MPKRVGFRFSPITYSCRNAQVQFPNLKNEDCCEFRKYLRMPTMPIEGQSSQDCGHL